MTNPTLLPGTSTVSSDHSPMYHATESNMIQRNFKMNLTQRAVRTLAATLAAVAIATLTGCASSLGGGSGSDPIGPGSSFHYTGTVYGGQNPVSGSTIQLYTVGTSGLKSASTGLIA